MSARSVFIAAALALCSLTLAAEKPETTGAGPKPLKGEYWIYGGELGDTVPPTKKNMKVAFTFKGPLAKELFDQIGPDRKDTCGAGPDRRIRFRRDLACIWDKGDGYVCYFGLDVPTGKSTNGSIC
jgi:hypothetical protein